jgi:hypothetical protein
MTVLCIQIRPRRAPGIDLAFVRKAAAQIGAADSFTQYGEEGIENGAYINLYFDAPSPVEAGTVIRSTLYEDESTGPLLQK